MTAREDAFHHGASGSAISTRHLGGSCRVCGGSIAKDEPALLRPWGGIAKAHPACGWLRPEERAPNEFRYPERWGSYWQWACPCCGRDVVREERCADLRCGTCIAAGRGTPPPAPPPERKAVTFEIPDGADLGACRSCDEPIAWIRTAKGKLMPVEVRTRESHFARCPKATEWRRAGSTNTKRSEKPRGHRE